MRYRPEQHLRRQSEIRTVRERGRRLDCGAFTLWWLAREPAPQAAPPAAAAGPLGPRVCVVASTAAVGKAHRRNLAKRRLRELFRLHQDRIDPSLDLLLVSRSAVASAEFEGLERRFLQAVERLPSPSHGRAPAQS